MRTPTKYCRRCGRPWRTGELCCPGACGCDLYGSTVPGTAVPAPIAGPLAGVLNGLVTLPPGGILLLSGPRGAGKTTIALSSLTRPHVTTSEQAPSLILSYAQRLGVELANVSDHRLVKSPTGETTVDLQIEQPGPDLVLDSISGTGADEAAIAAVRAYCVAYSARAICTAMVTKDGETRGSAKIEHDIDVLCYVSAGRIVVSKSRFGDPLTSRLYKLETAGSVGERWKGYYSIEGQGPDYRLVKWDGPHTMARWAAPLRAAERGELELPEPPIAVCAGSSKLYGGWSFPDDIDARVAFCKLNGISYFDPRSTDGHPH